MTKPKIDTSILLLLQTLATSGVHQVSSQQIVEQLGVSGATVNRHLAKLLANQQLQRVGKGPLTRYCLADPAQTQPAINPVTPESGLNWGALELKSYLSMPLGMRNPVTYQRHWVDDYAPNTSHLLPLALAEALCKEGRMPDPFRTRYRHQIGDAVRQVVEAGQTVDVAMAALAIPDADQVDFAAVLRDDLAHLEAFNCARFRLSMEKTGQWILRGRPA